MQNTLCQFIHYTSSVECQNHVKEELFPVEKKIYDQCFNEQNNKVHFPSYFYFDTIKITINWNITLMVIQEMKEK